MVESKQARQSYNLLTPQEHDRVGQVRYQGAQGEPVLPANLGVSRVNEAHHGGKNTQRRGEDAHKEGRAVFRGVKDVEGHLWVSLCSLALPLPSFRLRATCCLLSQG